MGTDYFLFLNMGHSKLRVCLLLLKKFVSPQKMHADGETNFLEVSKHQGLYIRLFNILKKMASVRCLFFSTVF